MTIKFNLTKTDGTAVLSRYCRYGKIAGFLQAHKFGLPVSTEGFIVEQPDDELSPVAEDGWSVLLCRGDVPVGSSANLPRGRDLAVQDMTAFLKELQTHCSEAILLAFKHPSISLTGRYRHRYETSGAANVVFLRDSAVIEYVGPGFDVGDLTRGTTAHSSISIPWEDFSEGLAQIIKRARFVYRSVWSIGPEEYLRSRDRRIDELVSTLAETRRGDIENAIPRQCPSLPLALLRPTIERCIEPLLYNRDFPLKRFQRNHAVVMINFYGTSPYVFEVWEPKRSAPQTLFRYFPERL